MNFLTAQVIRKTELQKFENLEKQSLILQSLETSKFYKIEFLNKNIQLIEKINVKNIVTLQYYIKTNLFDEKNNGKLTGNKDVITSTVGSKIIAIS